MQKTYTFILFFAVSLLNGMAQGTAFARGADVSW